MSPGRVLHAVDTVENAELALKLLVEVTAAANEAPDLDSMLQRCLTTICSISDWQISQAWLVDEASQVLVCSSRAYHGEVDIAEFRSTSLAVRLKRGAGLPGRVWSTLAPAWINDPADDPNFPRAAMARRAGLLTAFAFPVVNGARLFAIFEFFSREQRDPSPSFLEAVGRLGAHLAIVFERRRAEEARAHLTAFVEASPDVIASASPDGRMTYMNAAGRHLLGIGPDEDITRLRIADIYSSEHFETLRDEVLPAAMRDGAWRGCLPLRARDGHPVPISHVLIAHRPRGEVEFLACVGHDLSAERRLEEAVRRSQKMEAVGRLAGGMAHDFNNFLTSIVLSSSFALDQLPRGHPTRRELEEILATSERAARLTKQLLAFSRRQVLAPRVLDLNALLADLERMIGQLIGPKIDMTLSLEADPSKVRADPGQLEQVVMNLVINARDAMPDGGRVTIRTWEVQRAPGKDYVALSVSDTGSGMDEETRAHLFEPFFTTKSPEKGTGLGLSTVYGIVTQSGGEIEVETAPGRGSTFHVFLPSSAAEPPGATPSSSPSSSSARRGPATILLVEDEDAVRRSLTLLLEREGYTVLAARDGEEALEVAAKHQGALHLLMTDVVMPRMSGRELVERLAGRRPGLAVLFMSGYSECDLDLELPATHFIGKPFSIVDLTHKVRQALGDGPSGERDPLDRVGP